MRKSKELSAKFMYQESSEDYSSENILNLIGAFFGSHDLATHLTRHKSYRLKIKLNSDHFENRIKERPKLTLVA